MDSTIFNRRTLLGSGALVGLGALLAACGRRAERDCFGVCRGFGVAFGECYPVYCSRLLGRIEGTGW